MTLVGNVQLIGGDASCIPHVLKLLQKNGIDTEGNPDIYIRSYVSFGVEEARDLSARAASLALNGRRVFITSASSITHEAQNALLKTFEEAPGDALFFLIVPSAQMLLPTVRSRGQIILFESNESSVVDVDLFLKSAPAKRIEMLKPLLEKEEGEARDMSSIIMFLSSLERKLSSGLPRTKQGIESVYRARAYAGDRGSLLKPLLEQVALLV